MCVFDMNNLRTINNTLGHDKGDEYICSFAIQLRKAVPDDFLQDVTAVMNLLLS